MIHTRAASLLAKELAQMSKPLLTASVLTKQSLSRPLASRLSFLALLGFIEVFSLNHPSKVKDEIHYIRDGIRLIGVREDSHFLYYFSKEYLALTPVLRLTSSKTNLPVLENAASITPLLEAFFSFQLRQSSLNKERW